MTKKYHYTKKTGRPRKLKSVEEARKKIETYFDLCDEQKRAYSVIGLVLALGLSDYKHLAEFEEREEFTQLVKNARSRIERSYIEKLAEGKTIPAGLIFILKNNFGWKDIQGIEATGPGGEIGMTTLEMSARILTILELARRKKEELEAKQLPEKVEKTL